jgi:tetratricopeptide (TPR) repeat protein
MAKTPQKKIPDSFRKKTEAEPGPVNRRDWFFTGFRPWLWIAVLVFAAYMPTFQYGFSPMDDQWTVARHINEFKDLSNIKHPFAEPTLQDYYRPIWFASLIIDGRLGDGQPWMFHFSNVLLHLACCLLLFRFLLFLKVERKAAFFLSAVFAVHTINIHAVAWIPGRNDTLLGLFAFSLFISAFYFLKNGKWMWVLLSMLLFAGALFTKENAIVLPVLLVLYGFHFLTPEQRKKMWMLFGSWILVMGVWFFIRNTILPQRPHFGNIDLLHVISDSGKGLLMQIGKFFLPVYLSVMPTIQDTPILVYIFPVLLVLFVVLKTGIRNRSIAFFGLEWFALLIIIPLLFGSVSGNNEHYEHRMYVPIAGLFLFLSQLRYERLRAWSTGSVRIIGAACVLLLLIGTRLRDPVYQGVQSYCEAGVRESPHRPVFYNLLGEELAKHGRFQEAIDNFNTFIEMYKTKPIVYDSRGNTYLQLKKPALALQDFKVAVKLAPERPDFVRDRAYAYFLLGELDSAKMDIDLIQSRGGMVNEGFLRDFQKAYAEKMGTEMISRGDMGIASDTVTAYSYCMRGMGYFYASRFRDALRDFDHASKMRPDEVVYIYNRGTAYQALGRADSAYFDFKFCDQKGYQLDVRAMDSLGRISGKLK